MQNAAFDITISESFNTTAAGFTGNVDECAIFTSVLSGAQITAIYNSGVPDSLSSYSPGGWWRFESDSGTGASEIIDASGNANHGTSTNFEAGDINDPDVP
jgi:hypothetical protein